MKRHATAGKVSPAKVSGAGKKQSVLTEKKAKKKIKSKEAYDLTMVEIDLLMKKGEENLTVKEMDRLRNLSEAAENYEDANDPLPLPNNLPEMIRMRMFQLHLNQSYIAKLLGVSDAKFSMIMSGKQKPDIYFIKAIHNKLKVDANLILSAL
jgi:HTH-type transcriptional regulator/antitoxin HigA